ncbi:uncharacterized protein BO87DRAFT_394685 [Aspergillus neoniger CBS 115656]|uniref:Uncharacterized protein n=1 Tax=Aspergillus neoniger (strain CBS 115656) TaxID=1448310 RepID=A0A318YRG9_ASPNB|nr:hypothetical protein BO87DRAFT_394685 [Aspergillus neoniger CBS 115656]PYH37029.1 hypothetical protein BO87DRAFT_394685 [Aspergillus neoniger CBS 115656]
MMSADIGQYPESLSLNYSLEKRKLRILIFWFLVFIDSVALPIGLYYLLTRCTTLSTTTIFNILTLTLFGTFVTETLQRSWSLWRKESKVRVRNAGRYYVNNTSTYRFTPHPVYSISPTGISSSPGSLLLPNWFWEPSPTPPWIRMLAVPVPSLFFIFSIEMLIFEFMYVLKMSVPFRISSIAKGDPMRPALYPLLEDIIAVDGNGGTEFRDRLDQRYNASPPFRNMLHRLTILWMVPQMLVAGGTLAGIVIANNELAYTLGWSVPAIWAGIWAMVMVVCVRVELRRDRHYWDGRPYALMRCRGLNPGE